MSLEAKLAKVRSPNLQNQHQVAVVLSAVEDILREQKTEFTPTAYFAALLSLMQQAISSSAVLNKDLAASTVYLLDLVTPFAPAPLLRSKFSQILTHLVPALTHPEAEAPLLRSSIGVLESLLIAQDGNSWAIPQKEIGPRRAMAGLLNLALDDRPKVRKRAQEALTKVLKNPPPSPSLDHPAGDMCAATSLQSVTELAKLSENTRKKGGEHDPRLIHSLQLVKAVAASRGWPSKRIDALCEVLLEICRNSNEFLTMAAFGVFEEIFASVLDEVTSAKLPRIIEAISELRPSQNDVQLLPPWLAILARGYEVYGHVEEDEAFIRLPALFDMISTFLDSSAHNIRTSASQCLISLATNCIPDRRLLDITKSTKKVFNHIAKTATDLLSVRYQGAWSEVFDLLVSLFGKLRWRSTPILNDAVKIIGDLRSNDGFQGIKEADEVIGAAVRAMGPDTVLSILPLNLAKPQPGQPGRAWMLPVLRDWSANAKLGHFREEFVSLSEFFFQKVVDFGEQHQKTVEIKIFETLVGQIWALLPGYCDLPIDLTTAFDQTFAELLANVLYQKVDLRSDICKALQNLVESNKAILEIGADEDGEEDLVEQRRVSKEDARKNIAHLASFSGNLLAVLFNVYSTTLPQYRGFILKCLNAYLSITPHEELMTTFQKVAGMLETTLAESVAQTQAEKQKKKAEDKMPPMAHTLMDLIITITPYLPAESHNALFTIFTVTVNKSDDPQLQKKAYKVIPRLAETELGRQALERHNEALQKLLIESAEKATPPSRRDRLNALAQLVEFVPKEDLHFIPSVLSEVIICVKEVNEKARTAAFDLLVAMGEKMKEGGKVINSKVPHMPEDTPDVNASLEEYFTMVSAGLAGSTPHMISASITALTRILYQFKDELSSDVISEMVATMDLFLTSKNREIVRSVLGFVKVCVISLPKEMMLERFKSLIPNLMVWSHEHKAHFKAKVKHIIERMIRRFGYDPVERYVPEDDKKLVINIRKTRDRKKRHKEAAADGDEEEETKGPKKRQNNFASEFEEAIYGSESGEGSDDSDEEPSGHKKSNKRDKKGRTYIVEEEEEPLDLLDKKSLANISSTKPRPYRTRIGDLKPQAKAKTNADGKLILGADSDDDNDAAMDVDMGGAGAGVSAYLQAITGKDAYKRGQRNRIKFSNKRGGNDDSDEEMDEGEEAGAEGGKKQKGSGGKGGVKKQMSGRKGLGVKGVREGRVGKFGNRGRGRGRGGRR
ncbi:pre-rRNA processing protein [Rhizina undulata]